MRIYKETPNTSGGSRAGLWGASDSLDCLSPVRSFLALLLTIGNISAWGATAPAQGGFL